MGVAIQGLGKRAISVSFGEVISYPVKAVLRISFVGFGQLLFIDHNNRHRFVAECL